MTETAPILGYLLTLKYSDGHEQRLFFDDGAPNVEFYLAYMGAETAEVLPVTREEDRC